MQNSRWKLAIFLYLSVWFSLSAYILWLLVGQADPQLTDASGGGSAWVGPTEYIAYAAAGSLGGSLYALRAFHKHYDQPISVRFIYWYFMRPYLCGGTAMVLIFLLDSGILLLQADQSVHARIGLSFLAGFGHGKFMEKLLQLTETLFNGSTGGKSPPATPTDPDRNG